MNPSQQIFDIVSSNSILHQKVNPIIRKYQEQSTLLIKKSNSAIKKEKKSLKIRKSKPIIRNI
jgi:hypothetical protein